MSRFFLTPAELEQGFCVLSGENAAHAKVMRLRPGEMVMVCDGQGRECSATVTEAGKEYKLDFGAPESAKGEPLCRASVYIAYAKSDKLEHVVQKSVELGAFEIVFFPSSRCVSRPDPKAVRAKLDRAGRIALGAAEQSGRGIIPQVRALDSYQAALEDAAQAEAFLFLYEAEQQLSLRAALNRSSPRTISLMSGPEGGFDPEEVRLAQAAGAKICTLGPRILRCETAPLCALTCALFAMGEYDEN